MQPAAAPMVWSTPSPSAMDADGRLYKYLLQHTREPEVPLQLQTCHSKTGHAGAHMRNESIVQPDGGSSAVSTCMSGLASH